MREFCALILVAVPAFPLSQARALDRALPTPSVNDNGDVRLSDDLQIGRLQGNVFRPGPPSSAVQAESFGLPAEYSGDATAKINAALNNPSVDTVTFCGRYIVNGVKVPPGKRLQGCNANRATLMGAAGSSDFVVSVADGSSLAHMTINGNLVLDKGVAIVGDSVRINDVVSQYSDKCFYNIKGNVSVLSGNSHNNCHYGFYSADHWVNSIITNHIGANGSNTNGSPTPSYGFYWTYSTQQPQAIRLTSSQAYGDAYGIYFEKDAYSVSIRDMVLDGIGSSGITFDATPCVTKDAPSNVFITGSFVTGKDYAIRVRARGPDCKVPIQAYNQVVIRENQLVGNFGIAVEGNAKSRSANITIADNSFTAGPAASTAIYLDSPYGAWIERNSFAIDPRHNSSPSPDISVAASYSGTAYTSPINPPAYVRFNRFEKSGKRVDSSNAIVLDNIGGP